MSDRTVDWSRFRAPAQPESQAAGLRERKKQRTRQLLSDTATELFLAKGFDAVRVSEIAEACGVSEKTVFNYFPNKESLILDRWEITTGALRQALADPRYSPVEALLRVLSDDLAAMTSWIAAQPDFGQAAAQVSRFGTLIWSTPSLRAYQQDVTDRLTAEIAQILAARRGGAPDDAEPIAAAGALATLWSAEFASLRKHLRTARTPAQLSEAVTADIRAAARVIQDGLGTWWNAATDTDQHLAAHASPATNDDQVAKSTVL